MKAPCAVLCLALGLAACAHRSEVRTEASVHETTQETVQTGPETITTTVEEFVVAPEPSMSADQANHAGRSPIASKEPQPPGTTQVEAIRSTHLVKRTVTVDERGPVTATSTDTKQAATKTEASNSSTPQLPAVKCGFGGSVWGLVVLLVLLGAAFALWRLKLL
jgi:cobalamin biosynthesis Mg chelatase CobN